MSWDQDFVCSEYRGVSGVTGVDYHLYGFTYQLEACQVRLYRDVSGQTGEACQDGLGRRIKSDRGSVSGQTVDECTPTSKGPPLHPLPSTHISLKIHRHSQEFGSREGNSPNYLPL